MKKKPRACSLSMPVLCACACAAVFGMLAPTGCGGGSSSGSPTNPPVSPAVTKTTLTVTPAIVVFGGTVMLTAAVIYPPAEAASGIVTFVDGTVRLGSAILDPNGVGSLKVATLAVGTHSITAIFAATSTLTASESAASIVTVTAPPVTKIDATTTENSNEVARYDPHKQIQPGVPEVDCKSGLRSRGANSVDPIGLFTPLRFGRDDNCMQGI